ncbi:MAG: hypothetical protein LC778_19815 [Acidobacteria bacterium]|nr:hypothetical protein [Acidobacteriota bacterium]
MTPLEIAERQAAKLCEVLLPYSKRVEVAGSVRRKKPLVKDIEIVCIRRADKLFDLARLFSQSGWIINKGSAGGKYMQFKMTPHSSQQLDLFFATPENWGILFAIRTGSADFSHKVLASTWSKLGYESRDGILFNKAGQRFTFPEEHDLFDFLKIKYVPPEERSL